MVTQAEINEIIAWCEKRKAEEKKVVLVERNPFKEKIKWTMRFPIIEIDRPKEVAAKTSLVYDSTLKRLWQYYLDEWRRIDPSPF